MKKLSTNVLVLALVVVLVATTALASPVLARKDLPPVSFGVPVAFQAADPATSVRQQLEAQGYTVRAVGLEGAVAYAHTNMASSQFDDTARRQVVAVWSALSRAYTDPQITTYLCGLVCQERYILCFYVAPVDFNAWMGGRMTGAEFDTKYVFKVYDRQTGQWVTDKDFINKTFGIPSGGGGGGGNTQPGATATPQAGGDAPALTQSLCCGQSAGGTMIWSIRYPAGWQVQLIPDNPQAFQGAIFSDPQSTIQVIILPSTMTDPGSDLDQARNVDEFLDAIRARDERAHPGFKEARREPLPGLDTGRIWAAHWPSDKGQMWIYLTVLFSSLPYVAPGLSRGWVSMLGTEASVSDWSRGAATYQAMLGTMQSRKLSGGSTSSGGGGTPGIPAPSVKPWTLRWCPRCCAWEAVGADKYNWECPVCGTPTVQEEWEAPCAGGASE